MKTKLYTLCIGLVVMAGVQLAPAQVTNLGIIPAGGQSIIYWPVGGTYYVLQTVANLASTNWVTINAFAVNTAVVTNAAPTGFFRLMPTAAPAGMALIPGGWFTMGDTLDGELDAIPTNIYVSVFYMDTNLVSYSQWQAVYAHATNQGYVFYQSTAVGPYTATGYGTNYPVEMVDWFDCVKWSNARSQQAGFTPCYYTDAGFTQLFTNGDRGATVYVNWSANGYRLPTEAEWEKAARGGGIGLRFPWGNLIHANQAQYTACTNCFSYDLGPDTYAPGPSPTGSFDVNGYGLCDMAGNLFEWCWDRYGTPYGQPTTTNPTGAGPASGARVVRGGDWLDAAYYARCACRGDINPSYPGYDTGIGFRCVRRP